MSTIAWHASRLMKRRRATRAYCELDDWRFDPRYTEGKCPICGWVAPDVQSAPLWLTLARRFEWELAGLLVLLVLLVLAAAAVTQAAGYRLPGLSTPVHAAPGAGLPSPARTKAPLTSPTARPSVKPTPSRTP